MDPSCHICWLSRADRRSSNTSDVGLIRYRQVRVNCRNRSTWPRALPFVSTSAGIIDPLESSFTLCQSLHDHPRFNRKPLVLGHLACGSTSTEESIGKALAVVHTDCDRGLQIGPIVIQLRQVTTEFAHITPNKSACATAVEKAARSAHASFAPLDVRMRSHDQVAPSWRHRQVCLPTLRQRQSTRQTVRARQQCTRPKIEHIRCERQHRFPCDWNHCSCPRPQRKLV